MVVRKLKNAIAQAFASVFVTVGPATLGVAGEVGAHRLKQRSGWPWSTPRQAPVWKIAFVLFVHRTVGATSPLTAIL